MRKNSSSFKISALKKMLASGELTWDESIQRAINAWGPLQKSELIHSLLGGYYIPSICLLRTIQYDITKGKDVSKYSVIDGKQRLSVIFAFMDDKFALHKNTPSLKLSSGDEVELKGKKFSTLSKELQDEITGYLPDIHFIEEYTEEELEMMFYRLNNGTPLTKVQQSRAVLGGNGSSFVNSLLELDFFKKCNMSTFQKSREDNLAITLQGLMLIDDSFTWQNIGAKEIANYCRYLRDNFSVELQCKILDILKLLGEIFSDENIEVAIKKEDKKKSLNFLKRIHIPIIIKAASIMVEYNISTELALVFFDEFFNGNSKEYIEYKKEHCGEGSIGKDKVTGRIDTLIKAMNNSSYFEFTEENKKSSGTLEEVKTILDDSGESYIPREYVLG